MDYFVPFSDKEMQKEDAGVAKRRSLFACNSCEYLKIHRIQDVFEPWLAPDKIYE